MFTVFDGYCMVFMIYGGILSFIAIFYAKILCVFVYKNTDILTLNTWFLLARQQKIKNGGF